MGCLLDDCAAEMMPTAELHDMALEENVYDCAYLFPKNLLSPRGAGEGNGSTKDINTQKNYAIVNSLGGSSRRKTGLQTCRRNS